MGPMGAQAQPEDHSRDHHDSAADTKQAGDDPGPEPEQQRLAALPQPGHSVTAATAAASSPPRSSRRE